MKARIIKQQHALSDDGDDFVKELPVMTPKEQEEHEEHEEHEEFLSKMASLEMKARIIKQRNASFDDSDYFVKELPVMTPKEQERYEEFLDDLASLEKELSGVLHLVPDEAVRPLIGTPVIGVDLANDQDTVVVTKTDGNSIFGFDNRCFVPRGIERYF